MFFRAVPYADEDDNVVEPMDKWMIFASNEEGGEEWYPISNT